MRALETTYLKIKSTQYEFKTDRASSQPAMPGIGRPLHYCDKREAYGYPRAPKVNDVTTCEWRNQTKRPTHRDEGQSEYITQRVTDLPTKKRAVLG